MVDFVCIVVSALAHIVFAVLAVTIVLWSPVLSIICILLTIQKRWWHQNWLNTQELFATFLDGKTKDQRELNYTLLLHAAFGSLCLFQTAIQFHYIEYSPLIIYSGGSVDFLYGLVLFISLRSLCLTLVFIPIGFGYLLLKMSSFLLKGKEPLEDAVLVVGIFSICMTAVQAYFINEQF